MVNVSNKVAAPVVAQQVAGGQSTQQLEEELSFAVSDNQEIIQELKVVAFENESLKAHIQSLDAYIIDLKAQIEKYIPVRDDPCDKIMSDKINSHKNRAVLKNLFRWESEGLYAFGNKQIMVFLQQGAIKISVKGTNGKVLLEFNEFVDLYTASEKDKPIQDQSYSSPGRSLTSSVKYYISPVKKTKK